LTTYAEEKGEKKDSSQESRRKGSIKKSILKKTGGFAQLDR